MITGGKIVKFKDSAGNISAGTVVEIVRSGGQKLAKINTIDGKRIMKHLGDLFEVKNSTRGKKSSTVLKEVAQELGKEIVPVQEVPFPVAVSSSNSSSIPAPIKDYSQMDILRNQIRDLLVEKRQLQAEISSLKEKLSNLESFSSNIEHLKVTISCLSDCLQEAVSGMDYDKIVQHLLLCIKKLNKLEE